jgi:DNA-binding LacI/PurR family transcriptional regulator
MTKPRKKVINQLKQQIVDGVYRPGQRLPILMELTKLFGVSRGTVCNALDELVEQGIIVKRHGAGYFLSKNTGIPLASRRKIAFVGPGNTIAHYVRILEGVEHEAYNNGYEITFFNHNNQPEKAKSIAQKINPDNFAGVILMPLVGAGKLVHNQELLNILDHNNCIYIIVDTPVFTNNIIRGNYIGSDNYNAVKRLTKELLDRGYKSFGSIRVFEGDGSAAQRIAGLFDQLQSAKLPIRQEWHQVIDDVPINEQGRSNLHRILELEEKPEIIFCSYDRLAANVLDELNKLKIKVPEQIAVCGFDDSESSKLLGLTSVKQDFVLVGERALKILLEFINNQKQGIKQEFIPCVPVFRDSTKRIDLS